MTALAVGSLLVNGYDLSAQGLGVALWPGALAVPDVSVEAAEVSGRAGQILVSAEATAAARTIAVSGWLLQATVSARQVAWAAITRRLTGLLELRFSDRPGQYIMARCTGASLTGQSWQGFMDSGRVALTFVADDPYFYDVEPEIVALGTTAHPVPLGDAPQTGSITVTGPGTNPFVVYRDAAGVVRQVLSFGLTSGLPFVLGSADGLVVNLSTAQITLVQSGVATDGAAYVLSGDLPVLDPADADADAPAWPTLEVGDATSNVTGTYIGRRAWR